MKMLAYDVKIDTTDISTDTDTDTYVLQLIKNYKVHILKYNKRENARPK